MAQLRILGSLEIVSQGRQVPSRSRRQRTLLAVLLAHANRTTTIDQLLAALWADDAPDTAVGQLHTLVWRLRRLLGDAVVTRPGGYQLTTRPGELDAEVFADLAAEAAGHARAGRPAEAAERYAAALALWRGPAFADVEVPGDAAACGLLGAIAELTELRHTVEREHVDVELALGRHVDLVPRLRARVRAEPLHEELRERLMLALHRSGRRAEALAAYREGREALVDQLGLEPGTGLRRMHARILAADPTLDVTGPPAPAGGRGPVSQLPVDVADFVTRDERAEAVTGMLTAAGRPGRAPVVVVVSGAAGSGKTTLAVHVAHRVRAAFPDGQLFVDLRGGARPLDPGEALARFLRALGEDPRRIPADLDERAALFRSRTEGRRLLVVLDDAAGEDQVRPLLPADPGCAVLVTSRPRLVALPGAYPLDLGVFTTEQALQLMRHALGEERVAGEAADAVRIVEPCGHLPLAIRIAVARLAARPHWTLGRLADQLADQRARLDVLRTGDLAVRSSLAVSYRALAEPERRAFRLLGVVQAPSFPAWVVAPLLEVPPHVGEELVERLVEARLLDVEPAGAVALRYRTHDLVHAYAAELAVAEVAVPSRVEALRRLCAAWLTLAEQAESRLPGGFRRVAASAAGRWPGWDAAQLDRLLADPLAWWETERPALVAAVRQAAGAGFDDLAWDLAGTLARFFELREHLDDWRTSHEAALDACVAAGNRRGEAHLLRGLGELHLDGDRLGEALDCLEKALTAMRELGDRMGEGTVLRALGTTHRLAGRPDAAMAALTGALTICVELDDRPGRAQVLHNIGILHRRAGRLDEAERAYGRALAIFQELGDRFGEAYTLCSLGILGGARVDGTATAESRLASAVRICRELGYRRGEAIALGHLGELHLRVGAYPTATTELRQAVSGCREVGDRPGEAIGLRRLGELHLVLGNRMAARSALQRCLTLSRELGLDEERVRALRGLGALRTAGHRPVPADEAPHPSGPQARLPGPWSRLPDQARPA